MKVLIYSTTTGKVLRSVSGPESVMDKQPRTGEEWIESDGSDLTHYVDLTETVAKPKQDYTLEALPLPCTITIEGVEYPITEQPTITFNYPGTYTVSVDAGIQYLEKEFEVVWP